jgi:hypothetical protein
MIARYCKLYRYLLYHILKTFYALCCFLHYKWSSARKSPSAFKDCCICFDVVSQSNNDVMTTSTVTSQWKDVIDVSRLKGTHILLLLDRTPLSWNGNDVSHWRFHDNPIMNKSADVSKFKISPFSCVNVEFCLRRCYGALTVPCAFQYRLCTGSIKPSLQQFSFLSFRAFFRDTVFLYLINNNIVNSVLKL